MVPYLNNELEVNAQVHLGRHATYEWLPTKELAYPVLIL
jgi:cobalamin biosynthesis Mg chelatase CobN